MNRLLLLVLSGLLFPAAVFAQNQDIGICAQVIGATGKSATQGGRYYAYTIGEPFIFTLEGANMILTQGFHQPDLCPPLVATDEQNLSAWNLTIFPNPTTDVLHIRYDDARTGQLEARAFDVLGHLIWHNTSLSQPDGSVVDCTSWQAGIYFLQLRDPATQSIATVRFIRL